LINKARPGIIVLLAMGIYSLWSCTHDKSDGSQKISHVVVIGFDGLSPDGLQNAYTPTFDRLMEEGASTLHARAVLPTSSSSNWASMIMGAGPEQHGITSNAWERDHFTLPTVAQSDVFLFPTIFHLIRKQWDTAEIGAIYHWGGFGRLFEKGAVDYDLHPLNEDETAVMASAYIRKKNPTFTFIHFDHVDHAGHQYGHGTPEYYQSVQKADSLLSRVISAIEETPMNQKTLVLISSDHGGVGTRHGGASLEEIEIPFLMWGTGVKKNYKIKHPVYQYDNASTVAFALGIKPPKAWIGQPVREAFIGFDNEISYPVIEWAKVPVYQPPAKGYAPAGGLYTDTVKVGIRNPNPIGEIRYTLDGSTPTMASETYTDSIEISKNAVLKSVVFNKGLPVSLVSEAFFRIRTKTKKPPVNYALYYLENLSFFPGLENKRPDETGSVFEFTSEEVKEKIKKNTAVHFISNIRIEDKGAYTFFLRSDDGSKLFINNSLVIDNDGDHGVREKDGQITLEPGIHSIGVQWYNGGGDGWLDVYLKGPNMVKQILPPTMLAENE